MDIDRTIVLCLTRFIRQELKFALESSAAQERAYIPEPSAPLHPDYQAIALERVIRRLLDTFCDFATSAHAQRLVSLAMTLGRHLALSGKEIAILRQAALLHDIGKIAVPSAILHKPGPLDAEEKAIIRDHPTIGQHILLGCGGPFASLAPIIVAHHEYWDGNGYPAGLAGTDIPFLARVLAVVDTYDAMTSYRPYGQPLSHYDACLELQRCAGHQHDPYIVSTFLNIFNGSHTSRLSLLPALPTKIR